MKTKTITSKIKITISLVILICLFGIKVHAQNWTQIISGTNKKINTICFSSATIGYLGGNDSLLMKTTNGGFTWTPINYTGVNFLAGGAHIINLQFLNDSVGFMTVGPYSGAYGTTNGGLTWNAITLAGNQCFNKGLFFFDENNGFIGGSGCFQGELMSAVVNSNWLTGTWNQVTLNAPSFNSDNYITDITFYNNNYGLAVSRSGYVHRTINGGLNWDSIPTPAPLNKLTSVLIVNDTIAYAGYETDNSGFGLYISIDAGLTWTYDGNSATFYYPDFFTLHKSNNGTIYTGGVSEGSMTGLIFSHDGSSSFWNLDPVDQTIYDIASHSDSIVFAVGDSGYIVVNHPELLTGIRPVKHTVAEIKIFPNPAHDKLYFSTAQINQTQAIKYVIYSAVGQIVKSGVVQNAIDISELNAGIYFVEINGDEAFQNKYKIAVE